MTKARFKDTRHNRARVEVIEELLAGDSWLSDLAREDVNWWLEYGYNERDAKIRAAQALGY